MYGICQFPRHVKVGNLAVDCGNLIINSFDLRLDMLTSRSFGRVDPLVMHYI